MSTMRAGRALLRVIRGRRPDDAGVPPVYWGRIGEYEAVSRRGVLFLLSPEPAHPSLRVAGPRTADLAAPAAGTTPGTRMVS